jgi:nicotinamidase-related amidase
VTSGPVAGGGALVRAAPYPWPYHGNFTAGRCALVACADPRWRVAGPFAEGADQKLARLAGALRRAGALVVWVIALPPRPAGPPTELAQAPAPILGYAMESPVDNEDIILPAGATDAFYASQLDDLLRRAGRPDLVIAGWGLEVPVHSTLRSANDRGYECLLVPDACTGLVPGLAGPSCSMVEHSGGIFGAVAQAEELLALLESPRRGPDHPQEGQR